MRPAQGHPLAVGAAARGTPWGTRTVLAEQAPCAVLPLRGPRPPEASVAAARTARTVLLVEHDTRARAQHLSNLVSGSALDEGALAFVVEASDGVADAVARSREARACGRDVACVVYELGEGAVDVTETVRTLRAEAPGALWVVAADGGDARLAELERCFETGEEDRWDYVQRPVTASELLQRVRGQVASFNRRALERVEVERHQTLVREVARLHAAQVSSIDAVLGLVADAAGALAATGGCTLESLQPAGAARPAGAFALPIPCEQTPYIATFGGPAPPDADLVGVLRILLDNAAAALDAQRTREELERLNHAFRRLFESRGEALGMAREQVLRSARLAAVGQMAASVAHELNNPLCVMQLAALDLRAALELGNADERTVREAMADIAEQVARMQVVVAQLGGGATGPVDVRSVDLAALVDRGIRSVAHRLAEHGVQVSRAHETGLPHVVASRAQLLEVVVNLLDNAIDAVEGCPERHITASTRRSADGRSAELIFRDTGPGMSDEVLRRAVEAFFTTKPSGKGTGLGLAIVQRIVQSHGGQLAVERAPGAGAELRVTLPLAEM